MRRTRRAAGPLTLLLGCLLLSSCGTGPDTVAPSGVDELTVPSPSPDPGDFVADVDNPWWPLRPGTVATYADEEGRQVERRVGDPSVLGGVYAVPVVVTGAAVGPADGVPGPQTEWYAQDRRGNVWLVGGTTDEGATWVAGSDGVAAGLVVSAVPRVGDGYVRRPAQATPGDAGRRTWVADVDSEFTVDGTTLDSVRLEETSLPGAGADEPMLEVELARGIGPVRISSAESTWEIVGLPSAG